VKTNENNLHEKTGIDVFASTFGVDWNSSICSIG
jgi:hypothetical protein